jgi:hypothetical protein
MNARGWATLLLDRLSDFVVRSLSPPLRAEILLLSSTLRARRSVPFWAVTITSVATRACAPELNLRFSLRSFAFYLSVFAF